MEIYILLFLFIVVVGFFSDDEMLSINNKTIFQRDVFLLLSVATLFMMSAFREGIGTDYDKYGDIFVKKLEELYDLGWAYTFLSEFLRKMNVDYQLLIAINAAIFIGILFLFIKRFSPYPYISLVTLLGTYMYFASYNTFRQMTSVALVLLTLMLFYSSKKKFSAVVTLILSIGFHKSSVMFIPLFFLNSMKLGKLATLSIMGVSLIAFFVISESFKANLFSFVLTANDFFNEKYANSAFIEGEERGITNKVFFLFYWGVAFFMALKDDDERESERWIEQSFLLYIVVTSFFPYSNIVHRISLLFELLIIVMIPKFIFFQKSESVRNLAKIIVIGIFFVRFIYVLSLNGDGVVPYQTIFD